MHVFGDHKNSKFVQLELLNRSRTGSSKNHAAKDF